MLRWHEIEARRSGRRMACHEVGFIPMSLVRGGESSAGDMGMTAPAVTVCAHVVDRARKNEDSGAVHPGESGVSNANTCGKLGLVGMSKTRIETFKPPSADDPVLPEVVRRLVDVYHPLRIYLFGSAARGDAGPDSDYDLMVILPDEAPHHLRRGNPGYRALRGTGVAADVQVWPRGDFDRQLHLKASFPSTIVREGKLLYGA